IVPPWKRENECGRTTIVIQPAQAFGTGRHPTTAGALRAIESLIGARAPKSILDAGTGSGVLAIAAALLGRRDGLEREIIAIDTDPAALENARANARLNAVEKSIRFSSVPLASIHRHFELITANILSHTLIELAPHLKRLVAPGGRLVLGGFLADQAAEVLAHYRSPLRCRRRVFRSRAHLTRPASPTSRARSCITCARSCGWPSMRACRCSILRASSIRAQSSATNAAAP